MDLDFAADATVEGDTLSGVVHVFGQRAMKAGQVHRFDARAFDASIARGDIYGFDQHDTTRPLASLGSGTLVLEVKGGKLHYSMTLGHQTYAEDLRENVRLGLVKSMSFGVRPQAWKLARDPDGVMVRNHTQADLFEISPVTIPAYSEGTSAQLHSAGGEWSRSQITRARARVMREGSK